MSYVSSNLLKDEHVVYSTRISKNILISPLIILALGIPFLFMGDKASAGFIPFFIFGGFFLMSNYIDYKTSEFAVTDRRVIIKAGWIRIHSIAMGLQHVESVLVRYTLMGRVLNYGTITIVGTGGTKEVFHLCPNPQEFRNEVENLSLQKPS